MPRGDGPQADLFGDGGAPGATPGDGTPDGTARAGVAREDAPRRRGTAAIGPADVRAETAALAAALPARLRLGTSSWSFPGWAGFVYDREASQTLLARDGLAAYARHPLLGAVGIDRTFYAPIGAAAYARYARQVPAGFRFLVKAPAALTAPTGRLAERGPDGRRRFLDADWATEALLAPAAEGLGELLGVVLFQFPPLTLAPRRWPGFVDALASFLAALPRTVRCAVEVRDAPLVTDAGLARAYADALAAAGVTHCPVVHPTMPGVRAQCDALGERAFPRGLVPLRWMLQAGRRYAEARDAFAPFDRLAAPDPDVRTEVADVVRTLLAGGHEVLVVANNKAEGSAPRTLEALAARLTSAD